MESTNLKIKKKLHVKNGYFMQLSLYLSQKRKNAEKTSTQPNYTKS